MRDPIGRLLRAGIFAAGVITVYFGVSWALVLWAHVDRGAFMSLYPLPPETAPGIRMGDLLSWLWITEWRYARASRKASAEAAA